MANKYIAFLRLGLIHPSLLPLVWSLKRSKKTYLGYPQLLSLARHFKRLSQRKDRPIHAAEFGVGRGGSATLMAWMVGHYGGKLTLFDLFGRIPPPGERDGERAQERYEVILNKEGAGYYGNIPNLLETILYDISAVCDLSKVDVVIGKYEETLPNLRDERAFDLVHIDCDWYESSKAVLSYLKTRLNPGGVVQVDDFSNWEGSKIATSEARWLLEGAHTEIVGGALVVDRSKPAG
jgi:O-methyltransferase